jgi:TolA-binding protein
MSTKLLLCFGAVLLCLVATTVPTVAQNDDPDKLITFANGLFDQQLYDQALAQYRTFIDKFPQHANMSVALLRAGECLYRRQSFADGIKFFDRCAKDYATSPEADAALLRDGQCHFQLQQYTEAVSSLASLIEKFPQSRYIAQAAYWEGESQFNLNDYTKAIESYRASLTKAPKDQYAAYALYSIGLCQTQLGDADAAVASLSKVLTDYPDSPLAPEVSYRIGQAYLAQKRYDDALKSYRIVTQKYANTAPAALAEIGIGYCLYDKGAFAEAVTAFQKVATDHPGTAQAIEAQVQVGHAYLKLQKPDEAIAAYTRVIDDKNAGPAAQDAAFGRAVALQRKGDTTGALAAFSELPQKYPNSRYVADSYLHIGDLQLAANDPAAAEASYVTAGDTAKDADNKRKARYGVVVARFKKDPSDATAAEIDKVIAENPKTDLAAQLTLDVAQTRYNKGQYAEAAKSFAGFVAGFADAAQAADAAYLVGVCYDKLKRAPEATAAYEKAIAQYPKGRYTDQALGALVNLYAAAGNEAKADEAARQLREQFPQSKAVSAALFNSARALYEAKKYAEAAAQYDAVIKSSPADDVAAQAWYGVGAARFAAGDIDAALTAFRTVADKYPQAEVAKNLPDAFFQAGEKLFDGKNYVAAQGVYEEVGRRFAGAKTAEVARYKLGWALLKQDKPEKRVEALTAFLAVADGGAERAVNSDARYQAARILFDKPEYQKVADLLAVFSGGHDDLPMTPWALVLLGRARLQLQQVAPAQEAFRAVTTRFAKHAAAAPALLGLGRTLKAQNDYAGASAAMTQALAKNSPAVSVEAQYELADCKRLQKDLKSAAEEFLKVAILYENPQWGANAQVQAGACYEQLGDKDDAIKAYNIVANRYKDQPDAIKQAQERLKALGQ